MTSTTPVAKAGGRPSLTGTPNSAVGATMFDTSKNTPGGEGVLQNFFNSLLNRKSVSGAGGGSPAGASGGGRTPTAVGGGAESLRNRDVQAELNRLSGGGGGGNLTSELNTSQAQADESHEDKTQQQ